MMCENYFDGERRRCRDVRYEIMASALALLTLETSSAALTCKFYKLSVFHLTQLH